MGKEIPTAKPVTVSLKDLESGSVPFETLEAAFGPTSLGIIVVTDLPVRFVPLREKLLSYATYLAYLAPDILESITCPEAKYLTGWSHGRETLKQGVYDTHKGSFYVNCSEKRLAESSSSSSTTTTSSSTTTATSPSSSSPEHTLPNVWPPDSALPGFQATFTDTCTLVLSIATLVARACDTYATAHVPGYETGFLERCVRESETHKARLLHYFPAQQSSGMDGGDGVDEGAGEGAGEGVGEGVGGMKGAQRGKGTGGETSEEASMQASTDADDDWCATHLDHGCLTGLTSAIYINESLPPPTPRLPLPTLSTYSPPPDPAAGLYVRARAGHTLRVAIPPDALAFQTGEALQLVTRGRFAAVPHFVRTGTRGMHGVARNTLALFMQPGLESVVDAERGLRYGEFVKEVVARHVGED